MALDGLYLSCLRGEIEKALLGLRVDKISQPSREEVFMGFHGKEGSHRLYLSAQVNAPRIQLTALRAENPPQPPMFCMLLRKHLAGGKLVGVRQPGAERVLHLDFECVNELGDTVKLTLAAEMMGKYSNIILIGSDGKVLDALRRVDLAMSAVRPILPGVPYALPQPPAGRRDLSKTLSAEMIALLQTDTRPLAAALAATTQGIAPVLCRELALRAAGDADTPCDRLDAAAWEKLAAGLVRVREIFDDYTAGQPLVLYENDLPIAFSPLPLLQYGMATGRVFDSFGAALDAFYGERDAAQRKKQRTAALSHLLHTDTARLKRKLAKQRQELAATQQRDTYRVYADLINANIHAIARGAESAALVNYYDPDCKTVTVPLDPALSAAGNAQRYYKLYRKAQTAGRVLAEQIAKGGAELAYLETVADALSRCDDAAAIAALHAELEAGGYVKTRRGAKRKMPTLAPKTFVTDDGFTVLVGRNNVQNDRLTKEARGDDIWLHTKNIPGSHVILVTSGETPPERSVLQAAMLAALHSGAATSGQVPVDFTQVRHVHKPAGAKPGFVIFEKNRTLFVTPDRALAERLQKGAEN